jgi:hypothetical protein
MIGAMRHSAPACVLLLAVSGCGSSPAAPPSPSTFVLAAGAYRLSFTGSSCVLATSGSPATSPSSTIELPVVLAAAGGAFALSAPMHEISGQLVPTSSALTGTIAGTAQVGAIRFSTGPGAGGAIVFGGTARDGERFEGQMTSGQVTFSTADSGGTATAFCSGAAFVLRGV